jgi:hypothetical protein
MAKPCDTRIPHPSHHPMLPPSSSPLVGTGAQGPWARHARVPSERADLVTATRGYRASAVAASSRQQLRRSKKQGSGVLRSESAGVLPHQAPKEHSWRAALHFERQQMPEENLKLRGGCAVKSRVLREAARSWPGWPEPRSTTPLARPLPAARLSAAQFFPTSLCAHTRSPPSRRPPAISSEKESRSFFLSPLPPFSLQRAPAILQSIFASPDRTNQNDGSGIAVDCRITLSTVPTFLASFFTFTVISRSLRLLLHYLYELPIVKKVPRLRLAVGTFLGA